MATTFVHDYLNGIIEGTDPASGNKMQAVFVGKKFCARKALVWLVIASGLSVVVGFAAGVARKDSSYGLNVGFGVLAVLGWIQMVLAWQICS
jgi:hypothetical protein